MPLTTQPKELLNVTKKSKENHDENKHRHNNLFGHRKTEVIYGFLKVFPKDIGEYNKRPEEIVEKINSSSEAGIYGCKNWRIPTQNEVALLASRGIVIKAEEYLSSDGNSKGLLRLVADMPGYETPVTQDEEHENNEKEENEDQKPEEESKDKPVETAEENDSNEPEPGLKPEPDSQSKPEEAESKSSNPGCSVDVIY